MAVGAEGGGVGPQVVVLAEVVGALSQLGGLGVGGAVGAEEVGAWGSQVGVEAVVGVGAVVGSQGVEAVAGSGPAQRELPQLLPLGSPPWAWGSQRW